MAKGDAGDKDFHGFSSESEEGSLDRDDDTAVTEDEVREVVGGFAR